MRIGYAIGNEKMISYLNDVKYSFNSYTMNQDHDRSRSRSDPRCGIFPQDGEKVMETREWSEGRAEKLGFSKIEIELYFRNAQKRTGPGRFSGTGERHIYVRYFEKPRIDNSFAYYDWHAGRNADAV